MADGPDLAPCTDTWVTEGGSPGHGSRYSLSPVPTESCLFSVLGATPSFLVLHFFPLGSRKQQERSILCRGGVSVSGGVTRRRGVAVLTGVEAAGCCCEVCAVLLLFTTMRAIFLL